MPTIRVACYIDGFNVYHAIDDANKAARGALNYLKWCDYRLLMQQFTDVNVHVLASVKLFTAYPIWNGSRTARHKEFVAAEKHAGVQVIIGQFKPKFPHCKICGNTYKAHEEKESDVNIATHLICDAHTDLFDQAFLVTNDSDLLGPVRAMRSHFPGKRLKIIAPPFRRHSKELWAAATHRAQILQMHLEKSLMPATATNAAGTILFNRPTEYDPPI